MTPSTPPLQCEICIAEPIEPWWASWFENLEVTAGQEGGSLLCGPMKDQATLFGVLARIRDLNLTLVSVRMQKSLPQ